MLLTKVNAWNWKELNVFYHFSKAAWSKINPEGKKSSAFPSDIEVKREVGGGVRNNRRVANTFNTHIAHSYAVYGYTPQESMM